MGYDGPGVVVFEYSLSARVVAVSLLIARGVDEGEGPTAATVVFLLLLPVCGLCFLGVHAIKVFFGRLSRSLGQLAIGRAAIIPLARAGDLLHPIIEMHSAKAVKVVLGERDLLRRWYGP